MTERDRDFEAEERREIKAAYLDHTRDDDDDVRWRACHALRPLVADDEVKAALLKLTQDRSWTVVWHACRALEPLVADDDEVKAAFLRLTAYPHWTVRRRALAALGPLVESDAEVKVTFDASLVDVRADVIEVMSKSIREVPALRAALRDGRVDGSTYTGDCGCLLTTLAAARGLLYNEIPGVVPDSDRPAEEFYRLICRGDTPETSWAAAYAYRWAEELERSRDQEGKSS